MPPHANNTTLPVVCEACRARKRRCDLKRPICTWCKTKGRACVYPKLASDLTSDSANSTDELAVKVTAARKPHAPNILKRGGRPTRNSVVKAETEGLTEDGDIVMGQGSDDFEESKGTVPLRSPGRTSPAPQLEEAEARPLDGHVADVNATYGFHNSSAVPNNRQLLEQRAVHFDDVDLSTLSPSLKAQWGAIAKKVFDTIDFVEQGEVVWDLTGNNQKELQKLIQEIRSLQAQSRLPAFRERLERLVLAVSQFYDFYEQLRVCMITRGTLKEELVKL